MARRWVVKCYNSITEQESQELDEYTSPVAARNRAEHMDKTYGSIQGDHYYFTEIDTDTDGTAEEVGTDD